MTKVIIENSISLDGYVAGPNDGPENPLGDGGGTLHNWFFTGTQDVGYNTHSDGSGMDFRTEGVNTDVAKTMLDRVGSVIFARGTYDNAQAWEGNFTMEVDVVILTHNPPTDVPQGKTTFHFVDNIFDAVEIAKKLAQEKGDDKIVSMGGASAGIEALNAGLIDEVCLHIAPVILGGGVPHFANIDKEIALENIETIQGPGVTHVHYNVIK